MFDDTYFAYNDPDPAQQGLAQWSRKISKTWLGFILGMSLASERRR